jgi:hypothetical protein
MTIDGFLARRDGFSLTVNYSTPASQAFSHDRKKFKHWCLNDW